MNPDEAKLFAAELRTDLPELDLHGLFPDEAIAVIDSFLYSSSQKDMAAKIIYGGGTGKLQREVTAYLQKHPLVATLHDQGGSCLCLFN